MLYRLEEEEIRKLRKSYLLPEFVNAEMLFATFVTDEKAVKMMLPKPLLPAEFPLATVFVARYPQTNFGCTYNEAALFLHCRHRNEKGLYCLSMPVDDDMAMVYGREQYGFPKKMADQITLVKTDNHVVGRVVRKKEEIIKIECELAKESPANDPHDSWEQARDWDGTECYKIVLFLFKHFPSPGGMGFDYLPRLIREPVLFRKMDRVLGGSGRVEIYSSAFDPLGAVPVGEIRNMTYGKWHNTMLPGRTVGRAWNLAAFVKHAFSRYDFVPTLLHDFDPGREKKAREVMKIAREM